MSRARSVLLLACLCLVPASVFAARIPIRGRVLDAGGAPLAKAKVRLVPLASIHEAGRLELEGKDGPEAVASTESGADGGFLLQAPEPGMWKVVVGAGDGKLVAQEVRLLPLTGELDLPAARLRREGQPVKTPSLVWRDAPRARVRPASGPTVPLRVLGADGKPVAGVLVLEAPSELTEALRPLGMTGEDGRVELAAPGAAPLDVLLAAADGRQLEVRVRPVPAKEPPRAPQEARLPAPVDVPVRVVSAADGRPLAGALVWRSDDPGSFRRTDGRGAASLPGGSSAAVWVQGLLVQAAAPGFVQDQRQRSQTTGQGPVSFSFSLQPDLALTGVVVDEAGAPVTGAEIAPTVQNRMDLPAAVRLRTFGSRATLARSGPGGRFRLSGLIAGVDYELRVTKDGFAPSRVQAEAPDGAPGRPAAPLRIVLQRGRSAFGQVLGADRKPAAGVQVTLRTSVTTGPERYRMGLFPERLDTFEAVTNADGRFDLVHLPAGRYDVTARGRGWASLTVPNLEIPDEKRATDLGTLVLAPGVPVEGSVVDTAGKPVEGAEIRVAEAVDSSFPFPLLEERGEPAEFSGGDGFFRIEDLRAGSTVNLTVQRTGYAAAEAKGIQVPAERPVRISLQAMASVSGRVVDPDGEPIAGATVQMDTSRTPLITVRFRMMDRSDADGNFRIPEVIPGPVGLFAQAPGWQSGSVTGLELRSGEEKRGVEIVLARAAVLEGRVLASGRPVPDAQVQLAFEDRQGGFHSTITDADGRYVLDSLAPGLRTLEATHAEHGSARRQVEVRAGDNASFDIALEAGNEVSGRVVDDGGAPVAGAQVWLAGPGGRPLSAMSQSDGGFRFASVQDGEYRAGVDKQGFARSERVPVTVAGTDVSGLELRLSRGGSLAGRITGVEAAELSRVQIVAWGRSMPLGGRVEPDGSYRIENLQEGEWRVRAELPGTALYAEGVARLEPGASEARLDLEMERGLELSGRVRRNGAPAAGESIFLEGPARRRSIGQTDADGRFRFPGLAAGSYRLTLDARPGGSRHEETVDLQADREITIDLAGGEVKGRVVDAADASPLSNVTVQLVAADGGAILGQERTDSRGVFVLRGVAEGSLRVRAQADGYAPAEAPVQIDGAGPAPEVELSLRATEGVTLQVVSTAGGPPRSVFYAVLDGAGRKVGDGTAALGEAGRVRLSRVPPGAWQVLLLSESTAAVEIAVTAPGNAGQVTLPPPCILRVTVPALAESPVPATMSLTGPGGRPFRTFARVFEPAASWDLHRGTASLGDLPPGTWQVRVTAADGRTWRTTATTAPGAPVEVVVE